MPKPKSKGKKRPPAARPAPKTAAATPKTSPPTTSPAASAPKKQSEMVDRRLASIALQKSAAGETPSAQELAALKRVERSQEETMRWAYYRSIPQGHWITMSGRQTKTLQEQAERYGLPFGGAVVDLPDLVKKLHDFLADNAHNLANATPGILPGNPMSEADTKALTEGTDAVAISRAAMAMASRRLMDANAAGQVGATQFDDLKKSLAELRLAENDYLKLEQERGELIPRDLVKQIIGTAASRLVQCVGVLENSIAGELSVWLADPALAAMPADERARKVREFVAKTCNEVRRQEADGVEAMVKAAKAEEGADG